VLPLAACAPQIPQISYEDPAALQTEPPKPVKIVQMPELLPLPGQLKRMPRGQPATAGLAPRSGSPRPVRQRRHQRQTDPRRLRQCNPGLPVQRRGALPALRRSGTCHRYRPRARRGTEGGRRRGHDTVEDRGYRERVGGHPSGSCAGQADLRRPADEQHRHRDGPADLSSRSASGPGRPIWPRSPGRGEAG
jgi:hypothetical protein